MTEIIADKNDILMQLKSLLKEEIHYGEWLNVDDLSAYLPTHPAKQTIYGWTSNKTIPYHKRGKKLIFNKAEIDEWLYEGYHSKTTAEIEAEAENYAKNNHV